MVTARVYPARRGNVTQQASQVRARDDLLGKGPGRVVVRASGVSLPPERRGLGRWFPLPRLLLALTGAGLIAAAQSFFSLDPWLLFLLILALGCGLTVRTRRSRASEDPASVQSFGQYTLVRKLGEGGMGVVYEARHALLRRPTALKLLRKQEAEDPEAAREASQRFEREVQLTSQLSHPNTIAIYDYGQNEEGAFYYAMEYIDGIDLDRLVRVDGPLAPAHVIHLALQICGSLAEAHARSLIHRDIKPSNLLVYERAGVPDTIKVLDFGLVKSLHGPIVSAAHVLVGTPLYTAPEVLDDPSRAGPRSDIYALGAVLHWLATGKTLQEASVLGASALASLPVDLERVILRCTEAEPGERPESMPALAHELSLCRDHGQWTEAASRNYWDERGKRLSHLLAQPVASDANTLAAS
jgi:serine/threonine-protein kinase